jgi:hypothetical protein
MPSNLFNYYLAKARAASLGKVLVPDKGRAGGVPAAVGVVGRNLLPAPKVVGRFGPWLSWKPVDG